MRKIRFLAVLAATACLLSCFSGCGLNKKKDNNAWKAEAKARMPDKIEKDNAGKFYLNGHIYSFPFKVGELLENGWEYERTDDKEATVSGTSWYTYRVTLKDSNKHSVTLEAYNENEESCPLSDTYVGMISLDQSCGDVMFSGDITLYDNDDTFPTCESIADRCSGDFEFTQESNLMTRQQTSFVGNDDNMCKVTYVFETDDLGGAYVLGLVKYECAFTIDVIDYVEATFLAIAKNDPSYINNISRKTNGEAYVESARDYYAEYFLYVLGFDFESISTELKNKVIAYMDAVMPNLDIVVEETSATLLNTVMLITYTAPDDFDAHLTDAMIEVGNTYKSDVDLQTDPEFAGLLMDKLVELSADFTYTQKHTYEITYTGDEEQLDYDLDVALLCMLGGYEYLSEEE